MNITKGDAPGERRFAKSREAQVESLPGGEIRMSLYYVEDEDIAKLKAISDRLHAGSDKERDEGHKLWLIWDKIMNNTIDDARAYQFEKLTETLAAAADTMTKVAHVVDDCGNSVKSLNLKTSLRLFGMGAALTLSAQDLRKHMENLE